MADPLPFCPACGGTECVGEEYCGVTGKRIGAAAKVPAAVPPAMAPHPPASRPLWKKTWVIVSASAVVLLGVLWMYVGEIQYYGIRSYEAVFEDPKFPRWDTDMLAFGTFQFSGLPISALYLPGDGFSQLKMQAQTGRLLSGADSTSSPRGAVIREEVALWLMHFAHDTNQQLQAQDIVGKQIQLGSRAGKMRTYVVVGVAGKGAPSAGGFQGDLNIDTSAVYLPESERLAPEP